MANQEGKSQKVRLTVQNAKERDKGRNIARLSPKIMEDLNISTGDIIVLKSNTKQTGAIAWPAYPQDADSEIIRIDENKQQNAGVQAEEKVMIQKIEQIPAEFINLNPTDIKLRTNNRFEDFVKRKMLNYPVSLGDLITIPIGISREISFKVGNLEPEGICVVKTDTQLKITSDPVLEEQREEIFQLKIDEAKDIIKTLDSVYEKISFKKLSEKTDLE
ncbi:MAG: hypothetical protein EU548_05405, partial [Promethearchaeota archaeon]